MSTKRRTHPIAVDTLMHGPTPERLRHAEGAYVVGGDERTAKVHHMLDGPLEKLYARLGKAGGTRDSEELAVEYAALAKYRYFWASAGLEPSLPSVDLGRIFASDPSSFSGMAKSERQAHCRGEYRRAVQALGMRQSRIVDMVVCAEMPLEIAGKTLGWDNAPQGRAGATEILRDAGSRLAALWGIG